MSWIRSCWLNAALSEWIIWSRTVSAAAAAVALASASAARRNIFLPADAPLIQANATIAAALTYMEQSLAISKEIGDRRGEAVTSWNIGRTYEDQGDLVEAEQYISRAVQLMEEIGHPSLEKDRKHLEELRAEIRAL